MVTLGYHVGGLLSAGVGRVVMLVVPPVWMDGVTVPDQPVSGRFHTRRLIGRCCLRGFCRHLRGC
jgi:hypothetical protein